MAAETITLFKLGRVAGAAAQSANVTGLTMSMWEYEGSPSHGAVPSTVFANPDNTTQGAVGQADPAAGKQKWITALSVLFPNTGGVLGLYDRLLTKSGLDGTLNTAQNINGGSDATLSRHYSDADGVLDVGNEIFLEVYTAVGATATTVTCAYKNESGASKTTQAVTFGGTGYREAQRFIRLPLAAGDRGVSAVVSVTLAATTGTAGNFGIVVAHPVAGVVSSTSPEILAGAISEDIEVVAGACLAWNVTWQVAPQMAITTLVAQLAMAEK